ncbi:MAG: hypothetical protein IIC71_00640 [Acidobacteria bacterium]|nr:hypothetical protein [Acidobacteriota bacterium]
MAWIWSEDVVEAANRDGTFAESFVAEWSSVAAAWRVDEGVTAIDIARALRAGDRPMDSTRGAR